MGDMLNSDQFGGADNSSMANGGGATFSTTSDTSSDTTPSDTNSNLNSDQFSGVS